MGGDIDFIFLYLEKVSLQEFFILENFLEESKIKDKEVFYFFYTGAYFLDDGDFGSLIRGWWRFIVFCFMFF